MRLLVTAGPTREPIDAVRFLSNRSSGRMGDAIAEAACARGHRVTLVRGPCGRPAPSAPGLELIAVERTEEMLRASLAVWPRVDAVIMAAAPADFRPARTLPGKLKKGEHARGLSLQLVPTPDILAALGAAASAGQRLVGFALETERGEQEALRKLRQKGLDLIALNTPANFGIERGARLTLIGPDGVLAALEGDKRTLAAALLDRLETLVGAGPR